MENKSKYGENIERRTFTSEVITRAEGENRTIQGYAALYNSETRLWKDVFEVIAPGAFKNAITVSDIRLLKNHNADNVLGRVRAGNLRVWEDDKGMPFESELPETTTGNDTLIEVRNKLIDQCSFAFTVKRYEIEERSDDTILYRILEVDQIYDVSVVTYPAYPATEVSANSKRSIDSAIEEIKKRQEQQKPEPTRPYQHIERYRRVVDGI